MNPIRRILRFGLPTLGLLLGLLCLGRALETALDKDPNRLNKGETIAAGLFLGLPCTAGSLWTLWAIERDRRLRRSQRLQTIFQKAIRANDGRINALQFAMLAEVSVVEAKNFLDSWVKPLDADCQLDETGVMLYRFNISESNFRPEP